MARSEVIRDMGDTLIHLLRSGIPAGMVDPNDIQVSTPDDFRTLNPPVNPALTVFLYRIVVNTEMRNGARRTLPDGTTTRPLLPIDLCYLITPWASRTSDEYLIAGRVLQVLYDHAELGAADLRGNSWSPEDSVQLVLESLPVDDHFRIWETTDLPYRLSLPYLARIVGIEPTEALARPPVVEAWLGARMP